LPESGLDLTETFSAKAADPILVIGITGDHATPFQYASELTQELGNAVLLTLDGQGHAASYTDRSTCVDDAVSAYLLNGELPKPGTVCQDN
jgi:homoserine acetyltransferase